MSTTSDPLLTTRTRLQKTVFSASVQTLGASVVGEFSRSPLETAKYTSPRLLSQALMTLRLVSNTQASSISCRLCLSIKRTPRNVGWHRESRCPLEFRRHFTEWNRDALQLDPRYCGKILARNGIVASRSMHFWHAGLRRAAWDRYHPHAYVHMYIYRVCQCLTAIFCRPVLRA